MTPTEPSLACPCCGYITIRDTHEVCPICGWEYEPVQSSDPDDDGGPNHVSLSQAQRNFRTFGRADDSPTVRVRPPAEDDRRDPGWTPLEPPGTVEFVAELVFSRPGGRVIESHFFTATHPEIAYHLALKKANEPRYSRTFIGLAELAVRADEDIEIGKIDGGDADEIVIPKERLSAFNDPRWLGTTVTQEEIERATREPPFIVELAALRDIDWASLSHAYGAAMDVPLDVQCLASEDPQVRSQALWNLGGSIYHQGTIYPATAAAVPFLIILAGDQRLTNRSRILGLLKCITESASIDPEEVRKFWEKTGRKRPSLCWKPAMEIAEEKIAMAALVRAAIVPHKPAIESLALDADPSVAQAARGILNELEG